MYIYIFVITHIQHFVSKYAMVTFVFHCLRCFVNFRTNTQIFIQPKSPPPKKSNTQNLPDPSRLPTAPLFSNSPILSTQLYNKQEKNIHRLTTT